MSFFESTPIGRILNIFSRDLDDSNYIKVFYTCIVSSYLYTRFFFAADSRLPQTSDTLIQNILTLSIAIVFVVITIPWFLIALIGMSGIFFLICRVFRCALRDLKRLENVSRSPIYSHIATTMNGLCTVHAFAKERPFLSK